MSSDLKQLVEFLHSPQPLVRAISVQNLVPFSSNGKGDIFKSSNLKPIDDLMILCRDKYSIAKDALTILINICDNEIQEKLLSNKEFIKFVCNKIINDSDANKEENNLKLFIMLLVNLGKNDEIKQLLNYSVNKKTLLVTENLQNKDESHDSIPLIEKFLLFFIDIKLHKYDYLGFILADLCRYPSGRHYFLNKSNSFNNIPISLLFPLSQKYNKTRRQGIAMIIKNCLFESKYHDILVPLDFNIIDAILKQLATPKGLTEEEINALPENLKESVKKKNPEKDNDIILIYLECILLLTYNKSSRIALRERNFYPLIREIHKENENREDIKDACEKIVNVIMRDEGPDEKIQEITDQFS